MRSSGAVLTLLLAAWGTSAAEPDESDSYFPIWGEEARARDIPFRYLTAST
ncbi:lipoprotein [Klebsiella quasipneumoniae]|nr:lipoprotein [Klebsiella quasipneumoniae]